MVYKLDIPGDSKWPLYPLVGGHLTFPKGHLTIPKRSQRIARSLIISHHFTTLISLPSEALIQSRTGLDGHWTLTRQAQQKVSLDGQLQSLPPTEVIRRELSLLQLEFWSSWDSKHDFWWVFLHKMYMPGPTSPPEWVSSGPYIIGWF